MSGHIYRVSGLHRDGFTHHMNFANHKEAVEMLGLWSKKPNVAMLWLHKQNVSTLKWSHVSTITVPKKYPERSGWRMATIYLALSVLVFIVYTMLQALVGNEMLNVFCAFAVMIWLYGKVWDFSARITGRD